jgi:hypothetical protein
MVTGWGRRSSALVETTGTQMAGSFDVADLSQMRKLLVPPGRP